VIRDAVACVWHLTICMQLPITPDTRALVLKLVENNGETGAARLLSVSRQTVARILAGLPVQLATRTHVKQMLSEISWS
ncbi:hypothetical protein, partial [Enterococcus casseliflavus]|uniref:hypothetical protein n=1 Tax=Enterococcus casseliflavus TaxID=37734 RepID=UPI003D09B46D